MILLKTKCKSTRSLMSILFKTPVFLFPTLFVFCILILFVTKIVFLWCRLMILFINWHKTSCSLEKSEPQRTSLHKCEFIYTFNLLSYSWLIHVEYSSIIHEEKKNWGSHLGYTWYKNLLPVLRNSQALELKHSFYHMYTAGNNHFV